jgi:3D (Asp-Asp-Asp) domain-containing protein
VGDALALRMALTSNREAMSSLMPLRNCLALLRARLQWLKNEGYILYPAGYPEHKIKRIHARKSHSVSHHAFMYKNEASSSRHSTHVKMPKKKTPTTSNEPNVSFKTFDASYVLTKKSGKIVAKYVGGKHKGSKTCVWVPKALVSNVKGLKTVWVPKNKT